MNTNYNQSYNPTEICLDVATRFQKRRKEAGITQVQLAEKSNVSLGSVKRFERTGEIALLSLVKLSFVLDLQSEIEELFIKKKIVNIEEIIKGQGQNE
ncbi:MAG: helix-turn-helix domain-containing protein [Anaerovoracaceae bacterium]